MKILFVKHETCRNHEYLRSCLGILGKKPDVDVSIAEIVDYPAIEQDKYDVLIYHTHPASRHPEYFMPWEKLIEATDQKFLQFPRLKVLHDSHADGSRNAYERFSDEIPRIKNAPHERMLSLFDMVCTTTYPAGIKPCPETRKEIDITFCVNAYTRSNNPIRNRIGEILKGYQNSSRKYIADGKVMSKWEYPRHLRSAWISVCPPGYGPGTFRHLQTLNAKSLMLVEKSLENFKLLPNANLVSGRDYVSFELEGLEQVLDDLLADRGYVKEVSENGYRKYLEGYSVETTAAVLYDRLSHRLAAF